MTLHILWKAVASHVFLSNREWVTLDILWEAVSHLCLWPTGSESHCTWQSNHIFPTINSKWVTLHRGSFITSFLTTNLTGSKWHCTFCERQSHQILSYDQQEVSDIAHFVKGSLIRSYLMTWTNRKWVTLHILWTAVSSHHFLGPTGCEWHCTICESLQPHHIFSYGQQQVSDIEHFVKGNLITSFPMTNSMWVTALHILWGSLITSFLWPTVCEWHCTFCQRQSDHIFSYDQQGVSDIAHFVRSSFITSFLMTNRKWVIAHFVKGSLITFPMINRLWVTLHILLKAISSDLFPWPLASERHCTFCERQSHHILSYDQQEVNDIAHFMKGHLITSFPMTNSLWVTFHIFCWKVVSSHFSYDQQLVSDIAHFVKGNLITSFPLTNSLWVPMQIVWPAFSAYLNPWMFDISLHPIYTYQKVSMLPHLFHVFLLHYCCHSL